MLRVSNANRRRMRSIWTPGALLVVGLMLAGCLPGTGPAEPGTAPGGPAAAAGPKTLRLGMTAGEGPTEGIPTGASTGVAEYAHTFHAGLTVFDAQDRLVPRVAEKVPTVGDGDWKVFPDGQMEVTWKLRPNVKWHDGVPATAGDFAFGLQVIQDREFPLRLGESARLISEVAAPDPATLVVRWKQTYVFGNASGPTDILALPRHLMGDLYEKGDKQAFFNSPLWTREFVGVGPYRLTEWVEGTRLEGLAFADYFLGRPQIDRLIFQFIGDANGLLVSLLAGAVDVTTMGNFRLPHLIQLKKEWDASGAGTTFFVPAGTRTYQFQFRNGDAPWARDLRVRRALVQMLDRQALADAHAAGLASPADTMVATTSPIYRLLEQRGLTRYPFDLGQAERLMAEAGWTRAPGAVYRSSAGEPFTFDVRSTDEPENVTEAQAVAGQWKAAGLADVTYSPIPDSVPAAVKSELRHTFTGIHFSDIKDILSDHGRLTTAQVGTPANRYSTGNRGGYSNPHDRLYDQVLATLDLGQRQGLMADFLKIVADDIPVFHVFYEPGQATGAFRKGIRGPGPSSFLQALVNTWNIHEWDMD